MPRKVKSLSTLETLSFRFTFGSFVALRPYGINPMRPATYSTFPPSVGAAFVWAGQLHRDKPLSYDAVVTLMPTDTEKYYALMEKVATALSQALGVKQDAKPA